KIDTATLSRERASSTSSTTPMKDAKGPSETRTCSPTSKETDGLGRLYFPLKFSISHSSSANCRPPQPVPERSRPYGEQGVTDRVLHQPRGLEGRWSPSHPWAADLPPQPIRARETQGGRGRH